MVRASFWAPVLIITLGVPSLSSLAQDTTSGGPDSVIVGPYGIPRLVMNEGGLWEEPIKIFENEKVTTFVPDITSLGCPSADRIIPAGVLSQFCLGNPAYG